MMSKYADWSPASVFGSTVATSGILAASSSLEGQSGSRVVSSKAKVSPKKREPTANSIPQEHNNNDECQEAKSNFLARNNTRAERKKELAALLLQRQVQVWLLRRQETQRLQEVQRLRKELYHAAASVIRESYSRYVKRRAIEKYLEEVEVFETQLNALLHGCLGRKRQKEEVQRFAAVRQHQKQLEEDHKRKLVHHWLTLCVKTHRAKQEQQRSQALEKILSWVRRRMLRKCLEARVAARKAEKQRQDHRRRSAQTIATFYHVCKLRRIAKSELQRRRRRQDGAMILSNTFRLIVLRLAKTCWQVRLHNLILGDEAARKVQRLYRTHQVAAKFVQYRTSSRLLQRVFRGHLARKGFAILKQQRIQETVNRQHNNAATAIQRYTRGHLTRTWFGGVLRKLRERFRCMNCGVVEPSGTYCKYCGRHRTTAGPLSSVLSLHERWQLDRASPSSALKPKQDTPIVEGAISTPAATALSPQKPTLNHSRSASLNIMATAEPSTSLAVVLSPRHRRLVAQNAGAFVRSKSLSANLDISHSNSIPSISEQTIQRAAALVDLQAKYTASAQAQALEMHLARLQRAETVINRGITKEASIV
ncbi:hypothetical protein ON010_g4609 [Phytophthora cinnamomi]|nr:hypothetical protein ON010_g4609 [Phytophthora cinnamomi]